MELDDFKAHWNALQQKEIQQQNISPEKLNQIIMNATNTIGELHAKSSYWSKFGKSIMQVLIIVAAVGLITIGQRIYNHQLVSALAAVGWLLVIYVYAIVSIWAYKKQVEVFTIYNSDNLKLTLERTITGFRKFYRMYNLIYLFLYPAYFYAVIELLIPNWHLSWQTELAICGGGTVVALLLGHWYYKIKFFKKLRSLEADLKELNG